MPSENVIQSELAADDFSVIISCGCETARALAALWNQMEVFSPSDGASVLI